MATRVLNASLDTNLGGENASNELVSSQKAVKTYVDTQDTALSSNLGDLSNLTTSVKTDLVSAVNSLNVSTSYTEECPALTPVSGVATWTVTHNLGSTGVICSLYNKDGAEIVKNTTINSANQITITFNATGSITAKDYKIVVLVSGGSAGSGGGVTNHAQLSNLDYAHSGHTGFMKDDASNLSSAGQKVFDGQWVDSYLALTSGSSPTTNFECSLSSYLPNDNYNYEILIEAYATSDTTPGHSATISAFSDIITNNVYITQATAVSSTKNTTIGSVIIPIGSARKITFRGYAANAGNFGANILGYRRIGTNQ